MALSKKLEDRLSTTLKRFQSILSTARARDVNESDTVVIVTDLLAEMFGFDKYTEITSEYAIRGTYCDLALKIEDKLQLLTEVKAIGLDLKDAHIKQALDYGVNLGVEWVALTNGVIWKIYRVIYGQPIESEEVLTLDLLSINPRNLGQLELLYPMTREGIIKGALPDHYAQRQARNKFLLAALLLSDPVLDTLRRELRRLQPDIRISNEELSEELEREVLKREVVEGPKAGEARKTLQKAATRALRAVKKLQKTDIAINTTEAESPLRDILETLESESQLSSDSTLIQ
jgi:Type I restriction enzyme R protein N terminus (HSDR_N)